MEKKLRELINKFLQEYTGTGDSGGNATDGNDITSPRPFADDEDEVENYTYKSIYGGDGGHYKNEPAFANPNRTKMGMFEQSDEVLARKDIEYDRGKAKNAIQRIKNARAKAVSDAGVGKGEATKAISQQETQLAETNKDIEQLRQEYTKENILYKELGKRFEEMPIETEEELAAKTEVYEQIVELRGKIQSIVEKIKDSRKQRNELSKGIQQSISAQTSQPSVTKQFDDQLDSAEDALTNIGKMTELKKFIEKIIKEQAYGHATLTTQGAPRTRAVAPAGKDPYTGRVEYPYTVGAKTKNGMMEGAFGMSAEDLAATYSLEKLQSIRDEIMGDMEQEAEPEGGNIADMYADQLQGIDDAITIKQGNSIEGGPSYDEVYLKNKLVGFKDASEYKDGKITIYPDMGEMRWKSRSSQYIKFGLVEGELQFFSAFGMKTSYDFLKQALPELPPMGDSSYSGMMNASADHVYGTGMTVDLDTAKAMIQAMNKGLDAEAGAQSAFYTRQPGTGGTGIDETLLRQYEKERININLMEQMDSYNETTRGSLKQFFKMFEAGRTTSEVIRHYAKKGIQIPEQFCSKVKKQFESYKKLKLELGFSEQEAKDFKKALDLSQKEETKQISTKIFKK